MLAQVALAKCSRKLSILQTPLAQFSRARGSRNHLPQAVVRKSRASCSRNLVTKARPSYNTNTYRYDYTQTYACVYVCERAYVCVHCEGLAKASRRPRASLAQASRKPRASSFRFPSPLHVHAERRMDDILAIYVCVCLCLCVCGCTRACVRAGLRMHMYVLLVLRLNSQINFWGPRHLPPFLGHRRRRWERGANVPAFYF